MLIHFNYMSILVLSTMKTIGVYFTCFLFSSHVSSTCIFEISTPNITHQTSLNSLLSSYDWVGLLVLAEILEDVPSSRKNGQTLHFWTEKFSEDISFYILLLIHVTIIMMIACMPKKLSFLEWFIGLKFTVLELFLGKIFRKDTHSYLLIVSRNITKEIKKIVYNKRFLRFVNTQCWCFGVILITHILNESILSANYIENIWSLFHSIYSFYSLCILVYFEYLMD